jgi:hypothetical protein
MKLEVDLPQKPSEAGRVAKPTGLLREGDSGAVFHQ